MGWDRYRYTDNSSSTQVHRILYSYSYTMVLYWDQVLNTCCADWLQHFNSIKVLVDQRRTLLPGWETFTTMFKATIPLVPSRLDPEVTKGDYTIIPCQTRLQPVSKQPQRCGWWMTDKPVIHGVASACLQLCRLGLEWAWKGLHGTPLPIQ